MQKAGLAGAMPFSKEVVDKAKVEAAKIDADVFLYNGSISSGNDLKFIEVVFESKSRDKALLVLTTNGGDPDAAFRIARYFQDKYSHFTVLIAGRCKSAGTLLAIGAHELAFMPYGELGPLDIQHARIDRFDRLQSSLTIQDSLQTLEDRATMKFLQTVNTYVQANQGLLSFPVAAKAAGDFVAQLYAPVFARIDPEEIGVRARSMRIAMDYGQRLAKRSGNLKGPPSLKLLAETYPSHSFVIDRQEADGLFQRARDASPDERELVKVLGRYARFEGARDTDSGFCVLSEKKKAAAPAQGKEALNEQNTKRASANGSRNSKGAIAAPHAAPSAPRRNRSKRALAVNGRYRTGHAT
jgi:hypothetical protein